MKTIKILALLFAVVLMSQSCRKDSDDTTIIPPVTEPKVIVNGSVIGTIIDDIGNAVEGAMITFEDNSVFTDEFGVFQFKNEALYSSGTYLKITKDGFFDGSRRFYPSEGNTSMVVIELIPLKEVAEFNSSDGSQITFENVELDFESNSIMKDDGSAYSGNVNVAAKYLDPTELNTLNQMPGDLTGTTTDQNRVVLTSFAMITVELLDDNGNELQVQEGKVVNVKIPVPQDLLADAPSSIPMWHFDEEIGTWIEEGSAILVNGMYETSLAHFSFWNCDVPNDYIFLKGSIINRDIPIQGVSVVVTVVNGGASASTITDENGFFCGYVPNGVDLILEVFDQCGNLIYTQTIPASEVDILLDPINLNIQINVATLSGTVALCEGTPSSESYVVVSQGNLNNIITINDDFTFSGNISYCEEGAEILVEAIDPINALVSGASSYSINGDITVGELLLCEEQIISSLIYQFGDISINLIFTGNNADTIYRTYSVQVLSPTKEIYTITTIDWLSGITNTSTILYEEGQPLNGANVEISEFGFKAGGLATTKKVIQDGKEYLISTGTLSEIEITDTLLYDESYDELFYYMAFEI